MQHMVYLDKDYVDAYKLFLLFYVSDLLLNFRPYYY